MPVSPPLPQRPIAQPRTPAWSDADPAELSSDDAPAMLAQSELCRRFRDEVERYRCRQSSDDRYTAELLRRAIAERDDESWRELVECYQHQVLAWCRRADLRGDTDPEEAAAHAWEKFWRSFTARQFAAASSVASVLRYLKLCAYTAVADLARAGQRTVSLDNVPNIPVEVSGYGAVAEEMVLEEASRVTLWRIVQGVMRSEREAAIVELLFQRGLRSAAVPLCRPDLFASVDEVYSVTRNLLDRLRRSRELRDWLEREGLGHHDRPPRTRRRA